jgi:hypothetical protein
MAEQGDEFIGDVVVADAAVAAIPDMMLRQRILLVEVPFRSVGRGVLP